MIQIMKNNIIKYLIVCLMVVGLVSCEDFLDVNDDPNNPTTAQLSLLLPSAQINLGFSANRVGNENSMIFADMMYNLSESQYTQDPSVYNNDWRTFFGDILPDINVIIADASENNEYGYLGIAKVLKAYVYNIAVDAWGDVPFNEAGLGLENLTPTLDDDAAVYDGILQMLDEAISDLNTGITESSSVLNDQYYGGNLSQWIKLANTIKLRMYVNLRHVDANRATTGINSLVADLGNLITTNGDNFAFAYGTSTNPQNTNPLFQQDVFTEDKTFYMSNYFMKSLLEKSDPRVLYYFYRQDDGSSLDFQTTPCAQRSDCPIGYLGNIDAAWSGYIGRDHGDPSGLPGDNTLRTTWGAYPMGGVYDDGSFDGVSTKITAESGDGVMPFVTASMTHFWLAEAAVMLGTDGDAATLLSDGITLSMEYVESESQRADATAPAMVDSVVQNYIDSRVTAFNDAGSSASMLNIIINEKFVAEFGNGWEAWTDFRRTGMPNDRPGSIAPAAGYPLRLPYGLQEITTNPNVTQVPQIEPIFWDAD